MADVIGSNGVRVAGYCGVAALAVRAWWRERGREDDSAWPNFWAASIAVVLAMALGRLVDLGTVLADLGRASTAENGWYRDRDRLQVVLVGAVAAAWIISVAVAIWRTPSRRRRHRWAILAILSLIAFAALRIVSLHDLDVVLHQRRLGGVRIGAIVELAMLVATAVLVAQAAAPARSSSARSSHLEEHELEGHAEPRATR